MMAGPQRATLASPAWAPKVRQPAAECQRYGPHEELAAGDQVSIAGLRLTRRMGTPEDLVGACVFLARDAAGYVNGAQVPVDGGLYRTL
jgi:NAD(P)-dependent dehydrogenase (short-subunit alcohol dehydrogenase family)